MRHGAAVLGALLVTGCVAAPRPNAVHTSAQCPIDKRSDGAEVRVVQDAVDWQANFRGEPEALLGRAVDWSDERVVVFSLGRQPTLGVTVALASPALPVRQQVLHVPVKVTRPGPDQMAAMALSWPCVIATVARGDWTQVRVTDERGDVLAATATRR